MDIVILQRAPFLSDRTNGELSFNGEKLCDTLELPWKDNQERVSCIPEGEYIASSFDSPHNGEVWLLHNVPNRSMIEMHAANFPYQLLGCVAVGTKCQFGVANSKDALAKLKDTLPPTFILKIINGDKNV